MDKPFQTKVSALYDILNLRDHVRIGDVGANPMRHDAPYRDLLASGGCKVVGFEPQEDTMKNLVENKGPNEEYFNTAVGDGTLGVLTLHKGTGLTSLLRIRQATLLFLRGLRRAARETGKIEIATQRMDDIQGLGRLDFLKIDIQGAELSVFKSAVNTLKNVTAIQTEVSFFPLYEQQPSFGEIDVFLRGCGFIPHSFAHIEKRLVLSKWAGQVPNYVPMQMLDGDIIYLRDLSAPEDLETSMLKRMAILTEGIFGFTDVTLKIFDILVQRQEIREDSVLSYLNDYLTT